MKRNIYNVLSPLVIVTFLFTFASLGQQVSAVEVSNLDKVFLRLDANSLDKPTLTTWLSDLGIPTAWLSEYELRELFIKEQNRARSALTMGGGGEARAKECFLDHGMTAYWTQPGDTCSDILHGGTGYEQRLVMMQQVNEYTVSPASCGTTQLLSGKMMCVPLVSTPPGVNWVNSVAGIPTQVPESTQTVASTQVPQSSQVVESTTQVPQSSVTEVPQSTVSQVPQSTSTENTVVPQSTTLQSSLIPTFPTETTQAQTTSPTETTQAQTTQEQSTQTSQAQTTQAITSVTQQFTSTLQPTMKPTKSSTSTAIPTDVKFLSFSSFGEPMVCDTVAGCSLSKGASAQTFASTCSDASCTTLRLSMIDQDGKRWCLAVGNDKSSIGLLPCTMSKKRDLTDDLQIWDVAIASKRVLNLGSGTCMAGGNTSPPPNVPQANTGVATSKCDASIAYWDISTSQGPSSSVTSSTSSGQWNGSLPTPSNNTGVIVGGVVGGVAGLALLGGLAFWVIKKQKKVEVTPEMQQVDERGLTNQSEPPTRPPSVHSPSLHSSVNSIVPTVISQAPSIAPPLAPSAPSIATTVEVVELTHPTLDAMEHLDTSGSLDSLVPPENVTLQRSDSRHSRDAGLDAGSTPYIAIRSFFPTEEDELEVKAGDLIRVEKKYVDGWVLGQNNVGKRGVFPKQCIE